MWCGDQPEKIKLLGVLTERQVLYSVVSVKYSRWEGSLNLLVILSGKMASGPYNYSYIFKYIIIGDMGVGKSCLLHQFTEKKCKIWELRGWKFDNLSFSYG